MILIFGVSQLKAQKDTLSLPMLEDSVAWYAERMQEAPEAAERTSAALKLRDLLEQAFRLPGSWDYPFNRVPPLSVQTEPGGLFRLFSWQLAAESGHFRHFGFLQLASSPSSPIALSSRNAWERPPLEGVLSASEWIGQIYYRVHPFSHKGNKYWVLFGFSSADGINSRKIAEILHFDRQGQPVFGAPLFHYPDAEGKDFQSRYRIVMDFAAESQVSLNFDSGMDMILFDHLVPFVDERTLKGIRYVPDGSYSGFRLKKGGWYFIEKLAHQSVDEAPVPFPVLDGRKGRDIMGREQK
jgi:hypothetical protein